MRIIIEDSRERGTGAPAQYRFSAITEDYDGLGSPLGHGATEFEACADLFAQFYEAEESLDDRLAAVNILINRLLLERALIFRQLREREEAEHAPDPDEEEMDRLAFERAHAWGRA